ncbi:hypothetical protein FB451DRAFT_1235015 [Mycena latifolia]|nr:hypothetical protein FB451DRAFT_1235015 [Mycena latifolia]
MSATTSFSTLVVCGPEADASCTVWAIPITMTLSASTTPLPSSTSSELSISLSTVGLSTAEISTSIPSSASSIVFLDTGASSDPSPSPTGAHPSSTASPTARKNGQQQVLIGAVAGLSLLLVLGALVFLLRRRRTRKSRRASKWLIDPEVALAIGPAPPSMSEPASVPRSEDVVAIPVPDSGQGTPGEDPVAAAQNEKFTALTTRARAFQTRRATASSDAPPRYTQVEPTGSGAIRM